MFIPYNTDRKTIKLPAYGRYFEDLMAYCLEIEDREERTACAYSIAESLSRLYPDLIGENGAMDKVWDQLMIMSDFKLDVDFPCEVITAEKFSPTPARIPYSTSSIRFRHYGKHIERMIEAVASMEEGHEKDNLISMLAHQMKKLQLIHNKEGVEDAKILKDLALYSERRINLDPSKYFLHEFKEIPNPKGVVKKKRKR